MNDAKAPDAVARDAIAWWVRLQSGEGGAAAAQACSRWRAADPRHERAWARLERLAQVMQGIPSDFAHAQLAGPSRGRQRRNVLKTLAGVAVVGGAGVAAGQWTPWQRLVADYSTRIGERRRLMLAGDLRVDLASDSAVSVQIDAGRRELTLWRGQTGVLVPEAAGLPPLVVPAGDSRVVAARAHFGVLRSASGIRVDVYDGSLRLVGPDGAVRLLSAGSALTRHRGVWREGPADPGQGAWADGLLVANGDRLDTVLEQLSRYRHGSLSASPAVAGLSVSGVFPLDDTDRALAMLQQSLPITLSRWGPWRVRVDEADGASSGSA